MTHKAHRFVEAHRRASIEYYSAGRGDVTIRLTDGSRWDLTHAQLRDVGGLRFAHLEGMSCLKST